MDRFKQFAMAHFNAVTRFPVKLRTAKSLKTNHDDFHARSSLIYASVNSCHNAFYSSKSHLGKTAKGLIPFDPNDAPESKDLRTPYNPGKVKQSSLWKQAKDGVKGKVATAEEWRQVQHPSLFYRQDHKDISHLFKAGGLDGHSTYKGRGPQTNIFIVTGSLMVLLFHLMTREENDLDVIIQKQGWYRLLWLNAPYDSSKDPRSNKSVGDTLIGVPLIGPNTLLNNSEDE